MPGCVPLARMAAVITPVESEGWPEVESVGSGAESGGTPPTESLGAGIADDGESGEGLSLSLLPQPATSISMATEIRGSEAKSCNQFLP